VKISDFGLSSVKTLDETGERIEGPSMSIKRRERRKRQTQSLLMHVAWLVVGSPFYMAPEVLLDKGFDAPCDVYSFSIIMWETVANEEPYKGEFESYEEMVESITVDGHRPPIPDWFPAGMTSLIQRCWDVEPSNRLTFKDILAQNWYVHPLDLWLMVDG
jgi:serine/threonine protein kinase